jgi:hypothetical protein
VVGAALCKLRPVCVYLALTVAIPTRIRSLIIRTARTTTIRESANIEVFILAADISPDYRPIGKSVKRQIAYAETDISSAR